MLPLRQYVLLLFFLVLLSKSGLGKAGSSVDKVYNKATKTIEQYRKDVVDWDLLIQGFRRGHNFSLSLCSQWTDWESSFFSSSSSSSESCINSSYSYHVHSFGFLGYAFGADAGYSILRSYDQEKFLSEFEVYRLPGISAGIVFYFSSAFRALMKSTYSLERVENLQLSSASIESKKYDITMQVFEYSLEADFFIDINKGIHFFYKKYNRSKTNVRSDNSSFEFSGRGNSVGLGLIYHII